MTTKEQIFEDQQKVVEAFNAEFEKLAEKHGVRGVFLGVTETKEVVEGESSACVAFANSIMDGADNKLRKAFLKVWDSANQDFIENMKRRVQLETIAKILGKDLEDIIGHCDCEDCREDDSTAGEDTSEPSEPYEEDPASQVARENGEAAMDRFRNERE